MIAAIVDPSLALRERWLLERVMEELRETDVKGRLVKENEGRSVRSAAEGGAVRFREDVRLMEGVGTGGGLSDALLPEAGGVR